MQGRTVSGVPASVFGLFSGGAAFTEAFPVWVVGGGALIGAALAGIMTVMGAERRATLAKTCANTFHDIQDEARRLLLINLNTVTGGPDGISGIPKPTFFGLEMTRRASTEGDQTFHDFFGLTFQNQDLVIYLYMMALLLALVTLFVSTRLIRMPVGRAWEALREDEIACRSLGLNPTIVKLSAFTLGATFAGFAGSFFASRQGLVTPESFTFIESAMILAIVVLGGMGSQLGIILAAVVMVLLQEMREFNEYRMLIFGLTMIVMMIWRPQGLLPMQRPHLELKS